MIQELDYKETGMPYRKPEARTNTVHVEIESEF